ncbi:MAG: hypothetical protein M0042_01670 [Nitrospiraceae bacterium]|nr:hypothetical protein [Nitrospiraceae bacterium]
MKRLRLLWYNGNSRCGARGPIVAGTKEYSERELKSMIRRWMPDRVPKRVKTKDTADFFRVEYDDVVVLDGTPFFVRNNEREGRFGLEDEPKFWVKRSVNLLTGEVKILKWVFRERFDARIGNFVFECVRSPQKEARILELVRGRGDFMQGTTVADSAGHPLRILDYIRGKTLPQVLSAIGTSHEEFFFRHFPLLLDQYIGMVEAIRFLHASGEKHGDIRRDHLIRDERTGNYRWIDYDFNYRHAESRFAYDLFGLGNVLLFIAGRGDVTTQGLLENDPAALDRLNEDDVNIVFRNRVANLRKIYPYIPEPLNRVLMHFSAGSTVYYDTTDELLEDIAEARDRLER